MHHAGTFITTYAMVTYVGRAWGPDIFGESLLTRVCYGVMFVFLRDEFKCLKSHSNDINSFRGLLKYIKYYSESII